MDQLGSERLEARPAHSSESGFTDILHKFIFSFIRAICVAVSSYYPEKIRQLWKDPRHAGALKEASAEGAGISIECGVSVKVCLAISRDKIEEARFTTNGCGWAVAAAENLSELISEVELKKLSGLRELDGALAERLGPVPSERGRCLDAAMEAVVNALADLRTRRVEEWAGEKALICSCFGVSEEVIESAVEAGTARTVAEIGELCGAGTGCGSCQMLIREILEGE